MKESRIPRMANQIATFFASQPAAEQVAGVASHINDSWEPRMRRELFALLESNPDDLHPLVRQAAATIRKPDPI